MFANDTVTIVTGYKKELQLELTSILGYWTRYAVDPEGGFAGHIDNYNTVDRMAFKGVVLNSRILWAFSAAAKWANREDYLAMATRAFNYIQDHFVDREFGGVYWSVTANGSPLETRKQIYGLAFCIYGLAEYFKTSHDPQALALAKNIYRQIEEHSLDCRRGGYYEAFSRDWKMADDLRLSEKDENEKKTMNTHLHIIEAYGCLYQVWPDKGLKERIQHLLSLFSNIIINKTTGHLNLFMDDDWTVKSTLVSYGHDIEAAWLLLECAAIIDDQQVVSEYKKISVQLAQAAAEGLDIDGGLWYELDSASGRLVREKHSWPQAEAMVGFFNAWQITGDGNFLEMSNKAWRFIKKYIRDEKFGEWFWGVNEQYAPMNKEKAGFWKCPYHNSRACLELIKRIETIERT